MVGNELACNSETILESVAEVYRSLPRGLSAFSASKN